MLAKTPKRGESDRGGAGISRVIQWQARLEDGSFPLSSVEDCTEAIL